MRLLAIVAVALGLAVVSSNAVELKGYVNGHKGHLVTLHIFDAQEAVAPARLGHQLRTGRVGSPAAKTKIVKAALRKYPTDVFLVRCFEQVAWEAYRGVR